MEHIDKEPQPSQQKNNDMPVFKQLCELSLIDDYLFQLFVQDASTDHIIKRMIEIMLGIKINSITIKNKQHAIANDFHKHSVRLDAYVVDDKDVIYNIEVHISPEKLPYLPKRMRYYQSLIDRELMPSGKNDYSQLNKTFIIFITDKDFYGKGFYKYSFKNLCIEDNSLEFGDDTSKVVFNVNGTVKNGVSNQLVELLHYFAKSNAETAQNSNEPFIREVDGVLTPIKFNAEYGGWFMSYQEALYVKGMEKGREEGMGEGEIKGTVTTFFECGKTIEEIVGRLMQKFSLPQEKAQEYVNQFKPV